MSLDPKIRAALLELPRSTLQNFARKHNITLPEDASTDDIVTELEKKAPGLVGDKLHSASLLEMESLGHEIGEHVTKAAEKKIASEMKGIELLKWVFGSIGTVLTVGVFVAGYMQKKQNTDLATDRQAWEKKLQEISDQAKPLVAMEKTLVKANLDLLRTRLFSVMMDLLENFSLTLSNKKVVAELRDAEASLNQLRHAATELAAVDPANPLASETTVIKFLQELTVAVLHYDTQRAFHGPEAKHSWADQQHALWTKLEVPAHLASTAQAEFADRFESYRHNILGVIEYKRTTFATNSTATFASDTRQLDKADACFEEALRRSQSRGFAFTRPLSNRALVLSKRIELAQLAPGGGDDAKIEQFFDRAQAYLDQAATMERQQKMQSLILNNLASTYQDQADYLRRKGKIVAAKERHRQAEATLQRALNAPDVHPAIYSTFAEVKAEELLLRHAEKQELPSPPELEAVVNWVSKAIQAGYTGYPKSGVADVFNDFLVLKQLNILVKKTEQDFERRLAKTISAD